MKTIVLSFLNAITFIFQVINVLLCNLCINSLFIGNSNIMEDEEYHFIRHKARYLPEMKNLAYFSYFFRFRYYYYIYQFKLGLRGEGFNV